MRFAVLLGVVAFSITSPLAAQDAETTVVLRISRELIRDLTGVHFAKDDPIATIYRGADVAGNAHAAGTFDVKLHKSDTASDFDLHVAGNVLTQSSATRRPVVVYTHGVASYNATCRVVVQVTVCNNTTLDGIGSFRDGVLGALTRGLARPSVRRSLPDGNRESAGRIHAQAAQAFGDVADQVVTKLNQLEPMAKKLQQDLQTAKIVAPGELHHYHAATDEYLWLSIGRPDERMPKLLEKDPARRAPIELWFTDKNPELETLVKQWQFLQPVFERIITKSSPALSRILYRARLESEPGWHVIRFTPDVSKVPEIKLP